LSGVGPLFFLLRRGGDRTFADGNDVDFFTELRSSCRAAPMSRGLKLITLAMAVLILGAIVLWITNTSPPPIISTTPVSQATAPAASGAAPSLVPSIEHPLDAPVAVLAIGDVKNSLMELFGSKATARFLQIDDFPRRFVATVDNLGRSHAPPVLWPVKPTAGRFTVEERATGHVISTDNAIRYTPLVLLAESVDAARAADLYARMYPLLQKAYEELGYPNRYFNDRLVAVLDILLATPEVDYPVELQLTNVKGPIPSERPWVRYEYADASLESLSAGQKILLRSGSANERRLKARLVAFREEVLKRAPKR
jgi:hypothetical protein